MCLWDVVVLFSHKVYKKTSHRLQKAMGGLFEIKTHIYSYDTLHK